jgi:hypothetical protein
MLGRALSAAVAGERKYYGGQKEGTLDCTGHGHVS